MTGIRASWAALPVSASLTATAAGATSFEIGSVLLPALLVGTLHTTPAALGVIEGLAIGVGSLGRLAGGTIVHRARPRRIVNVGGCGGIAACTGALAAAAVAWQVAVLRGGAWVAQGVRSPTAPADIADEHPAHRLGRGFGLDRAAEYLGAALGAALAVLLVALMDVRGALVVAIVPGALAAVAALRARVVAGIPELFPVHHLRSALATLARGRLGWTFAGVAALEAANISFTLLILRAEKLLEHTHTVNGAVIVAVTLFVGYRLAALVAGAIGGRAIDVVGAGPALALGAMALLGAYVLFAETGAAVAVIAVAFVLAGAGLGLAETGEHVAVAKLAPPHARALAFGALSALQSGGRLAASVVAGILWTVVAPQAGLLVTAPLLVVCPLLLLIGARRRWAEARP
ncbi:MAG TPA: MFS transporter [Thermoleophilaceae bacterium]|nr:MFS transporter [Thermoleophilaceae bacterium]